MAVVRNLLIRAGADFSAMRKSMEKAQKDLQTFKNQVNRTVRGIGVALGAIGAALGIRSAVSEAMKFEASLQQINRLMGESASTFQRWADENASAFGLARSEMTQYAATFGNLVSNFASGTNEVVQFTQELLRVSSIISSATGRDIQDVMERIRSGLLGSTEAINFSVAAA